MHLRERCTGNGLLLNVEEMTVEVRAKGLLQAGQYRAGI